MTARQPSYSVISHWYKRKIWLHIHICQFMDATITKLKAVSGKAMEDSGVSVSVTVFPPGVPPSPSSSSLRIRPLS